MKPILYKGALYHLEDLPNEALEQIFVSCRWHMICNTPFADFNDYWTSWQQIADRTETIIRNRMNRF